MDWQELLAVAREPGNDNGALAEICRRFTGLVKKAANQNHLWVVRDDALAEGWLAVIRAVRTYDAQTGVPFPGYVDSQVRYAVWNLFQTGAAALAAGIAATRRRAGRRDNERRGMVDGAHRR